MRLKKIRITNLSSFADFENAVEFAKNNLIFGTNGAGKSTLVELLQLLDKFMQVPGSNSQNELKSFLRQRVSKESNTGIIDINLAFNSKNASLRYNKANDTIESSDGFWTPIKVFNDQYTHQTIGETFQMDLQNSGVLIGQSNIELEKARSLRNSLTEQLEIKMGEAEQTIGAARRNYKDTTDSNANIDATISLAVLLAGSCELTHDNRLLTKRKRLGFGKPDSPISKLDEQQIKLRFDPETIDQKCAESVYPPKVDPQTAELLKSYTEFFSKGLKMFESAEKAICPFCRRDWPNADNIIDAYRAYLESTYNEKRADITVLISKVEQYKNQVESQIPIVESALRVAGPEARKYDVDLSRWMPLEYDRARHNTVVGLLTEKYNNMEHSVSIGSELLSLQQTHLDVFKNNNQIISRIEEEIQSISARRKSLNRDLAEHFAKQMWIDNKPLRETIQQIQRLIGDHKKRIEELETESPPQDIVERVFNDLLSFIGLGEYFIDENRRLNLRIDKEYDISSEGKRLSSAQRKILSLCYFFAEIVSEIDNVKRLKNYILVFDDPVDSADYVYFHSIAAVIEKAESILSRILQNDVKFGQFFVLTHNSLLHDRLACTWKDFSRSIRKENGVTVICPAEKTINNYSEYIGAICRYYQNPAAQKTRMIYIGNVIRRVLEILASFESLGSNNLQSFLDGMGKAKLAILANHLSHESFSKVLNPLSSPEELRDACREVLEVIRERHSSQYDTIKDKFDIELSS